MTNIKLGDKFNIKHEQRGDGQWWMSGPYECVGVVQGEDLTFICGESSSGNTATSSDRCVKVDDD